jgi:polysaccharide chain length determinant protein (PEP-CTERM system associated)
MLGHRSLTPEDYLGILKRRWWVIMLPMLLLPIAAVGITFLLHPKYLSQTLVLVEEQTVPDNYVKPVVSEDLDERLASMKEQILSRSSIQPIIEQFNLYPGMDMDSKVETARKAIGVKPIHSEIDHAGGLPGFFISFEASDPHTAQQVCGQITSLFTGDNLRQREQSAQGTTSFLAAQLAEAKSNLDQQDAKLAQFERLYMGRLPTETNSNISMLASLNTQLEAANQSLSGLEEQKTYQDSILAQQMRELGTPQGAKTLALQDPRQGQLQELQAEADQLAARYTADYPDLITVRRKIADLKADIAKNPLPKPAAGTAAAAASEPAQLQQLRAANKALGQAIITKRQEQMQIQNSIRLYQGRIESSPLVEEQYKALTRDNDTAQKFYDDLLGKMNQSKMATDLEQRQQGEHFSVLDSPNLPDSPSFPNRVLFAGGGLCVGILIGLVVAGILEYRDTSIRNERDIYAFLKLPTLATISLTGEAKIVPAVAEKKPRRSLFSRKLAADVGARG